MKRADYFLKRVALRPTYTIGKLREDTKLICDVLEDAVRALKDTDGDGNFDDKGEGKIKGRTAIPDGTYEIKDTYSTRFKKMTLQLMDVPGYGGIRIHAGNTSEDTEGCLVVGKNTIVGKVTQSRDTLNALNRRIRAQFKNGYRVFITIS